MGKDKIYLKKSEGRKAKGERQKAKGEK